jgi:hypothetical protein
LNFGGIGGLLVIKLANPTKVFCSWAPHQVGSRQFLLSMTKPYVRAGAARILEKTDAAVRQKIGRLDSARIVSSTEPTELLALLVADRGSQILNLHQALATKTTCATSEMPVIHE